MEIFQISIILFMGGGGDVDEFQQHTGPEIAELLRDENVDGVVITGG